MLRMARRCALSGLTGSAACINTAHADAVLMRWRIHARFGIADTPTSVPFTERSVDGVFSQHTAGAIHSQTQRRKNKCK
jgi:hypothetical protein